MDQPLFGAKARALVGQYFGLDLARDWQIHEGYLKAKTKKEILQIGRQLKILQDKKAQAYLTRRSDGLTMRMMEDLLGADHHKIQRWMALGLIEAKRKGTDRKPIQGGDMWHFEFGRVREFVIKNPFEIDVRRVEPLTFIQLLAGMMS